MPFELLLKIFIPVPRIASVSCTETHILDLVVHQFLAVLSKSQKSGGPLRVEVRGGGGLGERSHRHQNAVLSSAPPERMDENGAGWSSPSKFGASAQKAEPRKNTWWLCVAVTLQEKSL